MNKNQLITLREAGKLAGYNPDYISNLIRQGKMEGQRIGRNWFTTKEAVRRYLVTQKFVAPHELVLSSRWFRRIILAVLVLILGALVWFYLKTDNIEVQRATDELSGPTPLETKEAPGLEVTTYSDESGDIGIAVKERTQE